MKSSEKVLSVMLALGLVVGFAGLSFAENAGKKGPVMTACEADINTYCAGVEKGHGAIRKCLKEHKEQLSPACKDAIKAKRQEHRAEKEKRVGAPTPAPTTK